MQKRQAQREQASGVRLVAHLGARPVWLLGVGCQITGLSFHVVALTRAPVTVVQPIIAAGIVFLVLLAALILHERPRPREIVGIALAMGGVVPLLSTAGAPAVLVPVTAGGFVGTVRAAGGLMTTMRFLSASTRIERKSTAAVLLGLAAASRRACPTP